MGCDWLDVEAMARGRPTCVATYEPYIKNIDEASRCVTSQSEGAWPPVAALPY